MSKLWTVIPAAGESRRFQNAGYTTIKPFLKIVSPEGKREFMLQHVLSTLPSLENIVVAIPAAVKAPYLFPEPTIRRINATKGQAETVYKALLQLPSEDSVMVLDCDMILLRRDLQQMVGFLDYYDVVIAVAETFDPNASRVDSVPFPTRFAEKEPISQFGIVGARLFKSIKQLTKALKFTLAQCELETKEPYLSMAINNYSGSKYAYMVGDFIDLGTPERITENGYVIV